MTDVSRSPERHTFQKSGYVERCEKEGKEPNAEYLNIFEKILDQEQHKFDDPKSRENNLEYDLLTTDWILEKVRADKSYAQNVYAALCNTSWRSKKLWPTLKEENWSCSWRYAGGIVADMRQEGDYIDWYCSGIRDVSHDEEENKVWDTKNYAAEGCVTQEIEDDFDRLGWTLIEYESRKP
jgi:hypothetical protein